MDVEDAENGIALLSAILNSADSQQNVVPSPEDLDGDSVLSAILNSTNSQRNEVFSPEDLAWVDSCLVKNSDISESDWFPLKNALLDIINAQSQSFRTDGGEDIEIPPYRVGKKIENVSSELNQESSTSAAGYLSEPQESLMLDAEHLSDPSSSHNVNPLRRAVESSTNAMLNNENNETLSSSTFHGNPFLPTYNEDMKEDETFDSGLNLDSSIYELEQASENIFKIWDFDVASEEGELAKQLNKALSENTFTSSSSSFDDSVKWKDLKEGSLDDLVAGIADLSLNNKV